MTTNPNATPARRPSRPSASPAATRHARAEKRDDIMAAALALFVERGFHGTAVPEIAERAKVGAGTIYRYFTSKEALVNAIYREQKVAFSSYVLDGFPFSAPAREQFRTMWMRMANFAIEHPSSFVFLELHHHAAYLDPESRDVEQRILALITNVVTSAQARGELRTGEPRLLMSLVMGAFIGVVRGCTERAQALSDADWAFAEQCIWEAVRS